MLDTRSHAGATCQVAGATTVGTSEPFLRLHDSPKLMPALWAPLGNVGETMPTILVLAIRLRSIICLH